jgi:aarF domain-containing kinase
VAKSKSIPKSTLARSAELLKLAAKVGGKEIKHRFQQVSEKVQENSPSQLSKQIEQVKVMVDSLGRLKGAAMKIGQLVSMDFGDLFPPEVRAILEQLQNQSPHFLGTEEITKILQKELNSKFDLLTDLSEKPIAAASIGQVHTAFYKGRKIVLKIQYPHIEKSIDSDLTILQGVVQALLSVARKKMDLTSIFDEMKIVFSRETNYLLELENLKRYQDIFSPHSDYVVPQAIDELCTERVVAMHFEEGVTLREWIQKTSDLKERESMGSKILDLYLIEYFQNAFVQSDPNPANFLVNSKNQLVLLDLGAVRSFERSFVTDYVELMNCVHSLDRPASTFQSEKMGFLDPREKQETKNLFYEMLRSSLCAFDDDRQPFDFNDREYFKHSQNVSQDFSRLSEFTPPPSKLIFLHRKLVGIFGLLRDLGLKVDLRDYWQRVNQSVKKS